MCTWACRPSTSWRSGASRRWVCWGACMGRPVLATLRRHCRCCVHLLARGWRGQRALLLLRASLGVFACSPVLLHRGGAQGGHRPAGARQLPRAALQGGAAPGSMEGGQDTREGGNSGSHAAWVGRAPPWRFLCGAERYRSHALLPLLLLQGLGEMMPEQLWDTTLNPATRTLRKLTIEDAGAPLRPAGGWQPAAQLAAGGSPTWLLCHACPRRRPGPLHALPAGLHISALFPCSNPMPPPPPPPRLQPRPPTCLRC